MRTQGLGRWLSSYEYLQLFQWVPVPATSAPGNSMPHTKESLKTVESKVSRTKTLNWVIRNPFSKTMRKRKMRKLAQGSSVNIVTAQHRHIEPWCSIL